VKNTGAMQFVGFTGNKTNELLLFRRELKNTAEYVWDKKT